MNNANSRIPQEEDYEFNEKDLSADQNFGLRAGTDDHLTGLDEDREHNRDTYRAEVEHEPDVSTQPVQPTQKALLKYGVYIVVVVAITLLSGLGWFAYQILNPAPVQRSLAPEQFGVQANKPAAQKNIAVDAVHFDDEAVNQEHDHGQRRDDAFGATANDEPGSVLPITPRTEQEQDEKFYDTLVSAAEQIAPPAQVQATSIKQVAIPDQVTPETADKFAAISVAIANQSKEMSTVLEAVRSVSAEIKSLKAQVDSSSTKAKLFEGKLNQLNLSLSDLSKTTETRLNEISKAAVAAAVQAVKKESSSKSGGNGKLVLVGGAIQSDYPAEKVAKRTESKSQPKPNVVAAQSAVATSRASTKVQAQPATGNHVAKCGAQTVSQVWKVKGLTYSGAYVRRDDGSALMLRADMEVPGFGRVKSFDPESRTVCTTSGLIAR